jgi:hypothetical protein
MATHAVTHRTLTRADAAALDRRLTELRPSAHPVLTLDLSGV